MAKIDYAAIKRDKHRLRELKKCQTDSWYLATAYLKYGWNPEAGSGAFRGKGLTTRLHKPIMAWHDALRYENFIWTEIARWHHKTTMAIVWMIQDYLIDPSTCLMYFHAVDANAQDVLEEVAWHLQHNEKLRTLEPIGIDDTKQPHESGYRYRIMPARNSKRFKSKERFTLNRHRYSRFPSLYAKGSLSEVTGLHCNKAYVDDIIGRSTIRNNQIGVVQDWYENTLIPVVDDLMVRGQGTPWADWGPYMDWRSDDAWCSLVIPGAVAEGPNAVIDLDWSKKKLELQPDYKLGFPTYGPEETLPQQRKKLKILERQMKRNFAPQIMVDPSPSGDKPWVRSECEHYITMRDATSIPGWFMIALSDPAPALVGAKDQSMELARGDGEKDFWAHAALLIRANGLRQEIILVNGLQSQEWDHAEGWNTLCRLQRNFRISHVGIEGKGGELSKMQQDHAAASYRNGVAAQYIKLKTLRDGKNSRFADLAAKAKRREFMICEETCDPEFLEAFLLQARQWRPNGKKNSLKYDDAADVVSYGTDPGVLEVAPQFDDSETEIDERYVEEDYSSPCRHINL